MIQTQENRKEARTIHSGKLNLNGDQKSSDNKLERTLINFPSEYPEIY